MVLCPILVEFNRINGCWIRWIWNRSDGSNPYEVFEGGEL